MSNIDSVRNKILTVFKNKQLLLAIIGIILLLLTFFLVLYSHTEIYTHFFRSKNEHLINSDSQEIENDSELNEDENELIPDVVDNESDIAEETTESPIVSQEPSDNTQEPEDVPATIPPEPNEFDIVLKETTYNESVQVLFTISYDYYDQTAVTSVREGVSPYINIKYGNTNFKLLWNAAPLPMTNPSNHFSETIKIQSYQQYLDPTIGYLLRNEGDVYRVKLNSPTSSYYANRVSLTESCTDPFSDPIEAPCGKPYIYIFGIQNHFVVTCSGTDFVVCDSIAKVIEIQKVN